ANQLANLFIEENLRTRERQAEGTSEFIDSQLQEAKKMLDALEAKVSSYKLQHNGELPQQEHALIGTLNRLQVELQGNQDATNRAQQSKMMTQSALSVAEAAASAMARMEVPPEPRPAAIVQPDGTPAPKPKRKSEVLQAQYDNLLLRYTAKHPDMLIMA